MQLNGIKDDADFVQLMRRMLAEFNVSHLDFYLSPKGIPIKPKTPQISWKKLSDQTGYLNIRSFETFSPLDNMNYSLALEKAFSELNSLPNLIIDLRDNSGGQIDVLYKTFGYFIPNGETVGYAFSRAGAGKINLLASKDAKDLSQLSIIQTNVPVTQEILNYGATVIKTNNNQSKLYQGKIALLINENCFSSCELFAATLQENRKATIMGKRSGGAVLGSFTDSIIKNMVFMKKDTGWRMQIPIIDFYTISGKRLEGAGVTPDIEISEKNADEVIEEAIKYLQLKTINKN